MFRQSEWFKGLSGWDDLIAPYRRYRAWSTAEAVAQPHLACMRHLALA